MQIILEELMNLQKVIEVGTKKQIKYARNTLIRKINRKIHRVLKRKKYCNRDPGITHPDICGGLIIDGKCEKCGCEEAPYPASIRK